MTRGKFLISVLLTLVVASGVAVWQRGTLVAWWHVRDLAKADEFTRETRVDAFKPLGESAVGPLLFALRSDDVAACSNLELGLRAVVNDWKADDPRTLRTVEAIRDHFAGLSIEGKKAVLHFAAAFVGRDEDTTLPATVARVLGDLMATAESDDALRPVAFALAGALVERAPPGQWQSICRGLAIKGLADANVAARVAAIQLVLREPLRKDADLLTQVVPLFRDGDASVRRMALVALGPNSDVVLEDDLLPLLHDSNLDIRHLCEVVLQSRGLSDVHVRMARLISDENPAVRLQVIPLLRQATDLDADVWLRRLTLDPAPAVRAAAARVASALPSDDLRRRLDEMAQSDPSATVREIARFYVDRGTVRNVGR